MSEPNKHLAKLLEVSASGYAAYAAASLAETDSESFSAFGPLPQESWRAYLTSRVLELASAVRSGQPRLFTAHIEWCRALLDARDVPDNVLRGALESLQAVLLAELPSGSELDRYFSQCLAVFDRPMDAPKSLLDISDPHGRLAAQYVLAVLEGNRRTAARIVLDATQNGLTVREAYLNVLIPAVQEIGRMWHHNEVTISEEHFVTTTTQLVMSQLWPQMECAAANGKTIVAAAVVGNRHEIGVRVVADFFEMAGWRVVYLGADLPSADLAQAVLDFEADVVVLGATLTTHLHSVTTSIDAIRRLASARPVKIIVGGSAFADSNDLAAQVGANALAKTPDEAVQLGETLTTSTD